MTAYRLPDELGGGEVEVLHGMARGDGRVDCKVIGVGITLNLPYRSLVKVEPVEPPDGTVVAVGGTELIYKRLNGSWWGCGEAHPIPWEVVSDPAYGKMVRLVPDPAAGVELPWNAAPDGPLVMLHDTRGRPDFPIELALWLGVREQGRYLSKTEARELAAALLAAAQ